MECGQSTGATYPCLMLSRTRLKRVNILSGAFTIHSGTFYTSDGWDDSLPGSCQTVPEYMYINFLLFFDRKPRGKWRQWRFGEAKKEAKIGFAAVQMTRREEDRRQNGGCRRRKNPIGNLALQSNPSSETRRLKSPVCRRAAVQSASPSGASQARWSLGELRTAFRSLTNPLLCR